MALICFICSKVHDSVNILMKHLTSVRYHNLKKNSSFKCAQPNCSREYPSTRSYARHLRKEHAAHDCSQDNVKSKRLNTINQAKHKRPTLPEGNTSAMQDAAGPSRINLTTGANDETGSTSSDVADLWEEVAAEVDETSSNEMHEVGILFTSYLNSLPTFNRSMVFDLVKIIQDELLTPMAHFICNALKERIPAMLNSKILNIIMNISNVFGPVRTEHLFMKHIKEKGFYTDPSIDTIDMELDLEPALNDNEVDLVEMKRSNVYIGLETVFSRLFNVEQNFKFLIEHYESMTSSSPDQIDNFVKGQFWQQKMNRYEGQICIPYFLYSDSFEVNNPLGSKACKQALTGYYLSFPSMPRHISGIVENIFLVMLAYTKIEKTSTNEEIMDRLISEVISLEATPLKFMHAGKLTEVFFLFGGLRGDNLGLNSLLDFSSSFSANFPCRTCIMDLKTMRSSVRDNTTMYRNESNYNLSLAQDKFKECGIHCNSVFNRIPNFHITQLKAIDAMHDYYEGYAHDAITACLNNFLDSGFLTISTLNERIKYFDFEYNDKKNALEPIGAEHLRSRKLKATAGQMKSFLENIPLMIGDLVPAGRIWTFMLGVVKMGYWIMKPSFTSSSLEQMEDLIAGNLAEYMSIFEEHLKPKGHFLTHYRTAVLNFGPAKYTACFLPEARHKPLKKIARTTACRKNIAFTIAVKDQLMMAYKIMTKKNFFGRDIITPGKGYFFQVADLPSLVNYVNTEQDIVLRYEYVKLGCVRIKPNTVLISEINDQFMFREILHIIDCDEKIQFICKHYLCVTYDDHLDAFILENDTHNVVIVTSAEINFYPNRFHTMPDGRKAVRVKS